MKKMLLATLAVGLMSVSAIASEGTISKILSKSDGTVRIYIQQSDDSIVSRVFIGTADAIKSMTATALTAKTTGVTVVTTAGVLDGTPGWTSISF